MITFFSAPKPFAGHIGVISVMPFAAGHSSIPMWRSFCSEMKRVQRRSPRNWACGMKRMSRATNLALPSCTTYSAVRRRLRVTNGSAIPMRTSSRRSSRSALVRARAWGRPLLLVGRRWDLDIVEPLDFSQPGWGEVLSAMALTRGKQRTPEWIDYFAFPRGLCEEMPPFAVGRPGSDNWMICKFRRSGVSVLDVSPSVVAIHQNHTYAKQSQASQGPWPAEESARNRALAGDGRCHNTIADATEVSTHEGIRPNRKRHWVNFKRSVAKVRNSIWFSVLDITRPARHALGLRARGKI